LPAAHRLAALLGSPPPWIMGVLNVTPDSFTDGGRFLALSSAEAQARRLAGDGAAIIDIGGESTAPGTRPIGWAEELARIEPVVGALAGELVLSVDTYHARTAARCLERGARIVNDVSACRAEPEVADVAREHDAVLVMMYAKDGPLPHATDRPTVYADVAVEVGEWLARRIDWALGRGLSADRLVVDPGMGRFVSLDPADSWRLLAEMERVVARVAPVPVLIGTSRKGFLGVPLAERDPVSQLTALAAVRKGATVVRTHDAWMMRQFLDAAVRLGEVPAASGAAG
jgi:dihydropteroate synthase